MPSDDVLDPARAVREACGNVSDMTLYRWIRSGVLPPPIVIRGRRYWKRSEWRQAIGLDTDKHES